MSDPIKGPKGLEEFEDFYLAHWSKLVSAVSVVLPPGEEAVDVAQEAFVRAVEHWETLRSHPAPDRWLFLTAFRIGRSLGRRARVRATVLPRLHQPESEAPHVVEDIFAGLSTRQRAVLLLRHHYGLSTRETAEVIGCREGTVKSITARAKAHLAASAMGNAYEASTR